MKKWINKGLKNKADKMQRFNFPDYGFVVEAKNMEEAQKKARDLISNKK